MHPAIDPVGPIRSGGDSVKNIKEVAEYDDLEPLRLTLLDQLLQAVQLRGYLPVRRRGPSTNRHYVSGSLMAPATTDALVLIAHVAGLTQEEVAGLQKIKSASRDTDTKGPEGGVYRWSVGLVA
jgi:hypothetical protein